MIVQKLLRVALLGSEWVMYLMMVLSVFSIGAMLERTIYFWRRRADAMEVGDEALKLLEANEVEEANRFLDSSSRRSIEAGVISAAARHRRARRPRPSPAPRPHAASAARTRC